MKGPSPRRSFLRLSELKGLLRGTCVRLGKAFLRLSEHLCLGECFLRGSESKGFSILIRGSPWWRSSLHLSEPETGFTLRLTHPLSRSHLTLVLNDFILVLEHQIEFMAPFFFEKYYVFSQNSISLPKTRFLVDQPWPHLLA